MGQGALPPIAGGVNTTDKLKIKRRPAVSGGRSAGTTIGGIERVSDRTKTNFFVVLARGNRRFASGGEVIGQTLSFFFASDTRERMRLGSIIKATTMKSYGRWKME
jgi:hypothetical protein